jgi:hypothetical protein
MHFAINKSKQVEGINNMIKIIKGDDITHSHKLFIDGVRMDQALITFDPATDHFTLALHDHETITNLISHQILDIPPKTIFGLTMTVKWASDFNMFLISNLNVDDGVVFIFRFIYRTDTEEWDRPYSFLEFAGRIEDNLVKSGIWRAFGSILQTDSSYIHEIKFFNIKQYEIIADQMTRCLHAIHNSRENVTRDLRLAYRLLRPALDSGDNPKEGTDHVSITFDFPESVRVPCEQYLLYFAQFLQDLGVKATSDLKHDAGQVLFTVTPANPEEALEKIRIALDLYIRLPANPGNIAEFDGEIGLQRLIANIDHLKGQLRLARAELRASDATIEAQQIIIQQQRGLTGEIILESIKNVTPRSKEEDKVDLFGGKVSLTKYKGKFFDLDVPTIYRELKRLFSKKSKNKNDSPLLPK